MEKRSMVGLIAVVVIVAVTLFAGCVEETDEPDELDDATWASICAVHGDLIQDDLTNMQEYLASGNSKQLAKHAGYLQEDAMDAYNDSVGRTVSPECEAAKLEYETAMLAYAQVGEYAVAGDLDAASEAAANAAACMERVNDMLDQLNGM
ncbi:MAG: hypothetical protein U9N07_03395 [Euryarchaeota archaeon]|nr:hypothetical protein [Euryarchaeota archaeon]